MINQFVSSWIWSSMSFTNVELMTIINVIDIRDFFKRTTNKANLNDNDENIHKLKKIWCANECVNLYYRERV